MLIPILIREASELKILPKSGKGHNFLDPPQDVLDFLDQIWEQFEIGRILNFGYPTPQKKNKVKTLKIA